MHNNAWELSLVVKSGKSGQSGQKSQTCLVQIPDFYAQSKIFCGNTSHVDML
jgi:hypothetical protein